uniref:long-chain-fatty-acid--CoA ligase n=1 Tax=Leptobrachium leishanense TaxID=445787 RepID=A0A8C5MQ52_9ANUR
MITVFFTALVGLVLLRLLKSFISPFFFQDLAYFITLLRFGIRNKRYESRKPAYTILDIFLDKVERIPDQPFILYKDEVYSYSKVDKLSNQAARAMQKHLCLKSGDCVATYMTNSPAYIWIWLGLFKLGCSIACLNNNIRTQSLLHCFRCSGAKVIIADPELHDAIEEVMPELRKENVQVYYLSETAISENSETFLDKVKAASDEPLPKSLRSSVYGKSLAMYVYTSGTTGLPKAAYIGHGRILRGTGLFDICKIQQKDVVYTPLPLYHILAMMVGICGTITKGCSVVIVQKFSANRFWDDCRKHKVTVVPYIGEVMRYLCNVPERDNDASHNIRVAIGGGLRIDVWHEVRRRFGDFHIYESYASTEGNIGLINYANKIGSVGRVNYFQQKLTPFEIIEYDVDKDEPFRDANGWCVRVKKGVPGLMIGKISAASPFVGYAGDKSNTEKKVLRNVFRKGDMYFNSGDLLMVDQENFVYFSDRIGDTFRWKGENVSTNEVSDILSLVNFIQEVNIYGVHVPDHEGRVGMASIRLRENNEFDGEKLYAHVRDSLPNYARPLFIRIQQPETRFLCTG